MVVGRASIYFGIVLFSKRIGLIEGAQDGGCIGNGSLAIPDYANIKMSH